MQAVILAAGRGTRMGAMTESTPKPMLELLGKPLLEWKLAMLPKTIDEVIFVIGYHRNQIEKYFGGNWKGTKISYAIQETLNGTGGAIVLVKNMVRKNFLVMMGDDLYHQNDLSKLADEELAVLGLEVDNAERFGLLEKNVTGNLEKITERPHGKETGIVNTGAYLLQSKFFEYPMVKISAAEYGLPQTLCLMGQGVPVKVLRARAWQPVGKPEDIALGEEFLRKYWIKK